MKNKFMIALTVKTLIQEGHEIYYDVTNDELVIEKDDMILTFKSESKFQEWINKKS